MGQRSAERNKSGQRVPSANRRGVLFSVELLFVLPILLLLLCGIIEFGLLLSATHRLQAATEVACRVGTRPVASRAALEREIRSAAREALVSRRLVSNHELRFRPGRHSGDRVTVEIEVPMQAAAPNLLTVVGFDLRGRYLRSRVTMRRE